MKKEELKKRPFLSEILKENDSTKVRNSDLENAIKMAVFKGISLDDTILFLNKPKSKKKKTLIESFYNVISALL